MPSRAAGEAAPRAPRRRHATEPGAPAPAGAGAPDDRKPAPRARSAGAGATGTRRSTADRAQQQADETPASRNAAALNTNGPEYLTAPSRASRRRRSGRGWGRRPHLSSSPTRPRTAADRGGPAQRGRPRLPGLVVGRVATAEQEQPGEQQRQRRATAATTTSTAPTAPDDVGQGEAGPATPAVIKRLIGTASRAAPTTNELWPRPEIACRPWTPRAGRRPRCRWPPRPRRRSASTSSTVRVRRWIRTTPSDLKGATAVAAHDTIISRSPDGRPDRNGVTGGHRPRPRPMISFMISVVPP